VAMTSRSVFLQVSAVILLALFWAVNWPIMKIGLTVVEPWTFRAAVVVVGGIGCLLVARMMGLSIAIPRGDLRALLWLTLFQGVLWNAFSGFGIALVDAGRASVLGFTMPVWATLVSIVVLKEAVTPRRMSGLGLGLVAMGLLLLPVVDSLTGQFTGALLMLAGAMCWGVATVMVKAHDWEMNMMALSGWQFVVGSVPLGLAALVLGDPASLLRVDAVAAAAVAYSALIPMIFCQAIWFTIVRRLPTVMASTGTLLVPPLGVLSAALILGETVSGLDIAALFLVLAAMVLILPGFNWRAILRQRQVSPPE
jgi:drug/metabolite transporter (DMT)-like permease